MTVVSSTLLCIIFLGKRDCAAGKRAFLFKRVRQATNKNPNPMMNSAGEKTPVVVHVSVMPNFLLKCGFTQNQRFCTRMPRMKILASAHSPLVAFSFRLKIYIFRIGKGGRREKAEFCAIKTSTLGRRIKCMKARRRKGPPLQGW